MIQLKVKKLHPYAKMPERATEDSACFDVSTTGSDFMSEGEEDDSVVIYNTGLAFEVPKNHTMLIFPRSSVYKTGQMLANGVGVLDSDYRGELKVLMKVVSGRLEIYNPGDRVAQIMILPLPKVEIQEVNTLSETVRGDGGFGSTGK